MPQQDIIDSGIPLPAVVGVDYLGGPKLHLVFDDDSGDWLVRCAKEFADRLRSDAFTDALWVIVSAHARSQNTH